MDFVYIPVVPLREDPPRNPQPIGIPEGMEPEALRISFPKPGSVHSTVMHWSTEESKLMACAAVDCWRCIKGVRAIQRYEMKVTHEGATKLISMPYALYDRVRRMRLDLGDGAFYEAEYLLLRVGNDCHRAEFVLQVAR